RTAVSDHICIEAADAPADSYQHERRRRERFGSGAADHGAEGRRKEIRVQDLSGRAGRPHVQQAGYEARARIRPGDLQVPRRILEAENMIQDSLAKDRSQARSMVITTSGVIATSQTLASQAGAQTLARGGSAIDAAIAANAVLSVVEPMMCGLGGD